MIRPLLVALIALLPGASWAATDPFGRDAVKVLWVDQNNPSCDDARPRSEAETPATPWCTWQPAFSKATAGDTIYIRCGNAGSGNGSCAYRSAQRSLASRGDMCTVTATVSGTAAQPIILTAYQGDDVTIDGRSPLRDLDENGTLEQPTWTACAHVSGACQCGSATYEFGTADATNCGRIYFLNLVSPWTAGTLNQFGGPFHRDWLQLWDGTRLIAGADCQWHSGNCLGASGSNQGLGDLLVGGRWTIDPNIDRLFYHRADHTNPNDGTQWVGHCNRMLGAAGADWWTIKNLKLQGFVNRGIQLGQGSGGNLTTGWTFDGITTRGIGDAGCTKYRCVAGRNHYRHCAVAADCPGGSCVAGRDSTGGYHLSLNGSTAPIVVKNSVLYQSSGEAIHVYLGGNPCAGASGHVCGVTIQDNDFYADADTGWDAECANRGQVLPTDYAWDIKEEGPAIIDGSEGLVIERNRFFDFTDHNSAAIELERNDPGGTIIRGNEFTLAPSGTAIFGLADGAAIANVEIYNNVIRGGRCQVELEGNLVNWKVYNNLLRDGVSTTACPTGGGAGSALTVLCRVASGVTTCPTGLDLRNNIIANHLGREINWCSSCLAGAVLQNNAVFDDDGATVLQWGGSAYRCAQFDTETNVPTEGDANRCVEPQLMASDRLADASPFRASGQTLSRTLTTDKAGALRTAPWSAGPYESDGTVVPAVDRLDDAPAGQPSATPAQPASGERP